MRVARAGTSACCARGLQRANIEEEDKNKLRAHTFQTLSPTDTPSPHHRTLVHALGSACVCVCVCASPLLSYSLTRTPLMHTSNACLAPEFARKGEESRHTQLQFCLQVHPRRILVAQSLMRNGKSETPQRICKCMCARARSREHNEQARACQSGIERRGLRCVLTQS